MFFHRRGEISTDREFKRPTRDSFRSWAKEFSDLNSNLCLDVYLVGAFCENFFGGKNLPTWDVDIVLMGPPEDKTSLKRALDSAFSIGIKNDILIDIVWRNQILTPQSDPKGRYEKITNYLTVETVEGTDAKKIYNIEGDCTQIFPGLFLVTNFDVSRALEKTKKKLYSVQYKKLNFNGLEG